MNIRTISAILMACTFAAHTGHDLNAEPPPASSNVILRGDFLNSRIRFERDGKGHVAFLGGSITEMDGYRPIVMARLKKRFPKTEFTFTNAGLSSTCSNTGAFRLQKDILDKGPVDLFFVEFAVNDHQDAALSRARATRGMEGILVQLRQDNPNADIVMTHFVNPPMLKALEGSKEFTSIDAHNAVAAHYGITVNHVAQELTDRIAAGSMTWKEYGGVHPAPPGNAMAAGMIMDSLEKKWGGELPADARPKAYPVQELLDPHSYSRGRYVDASAIQADQGWTRSVPSLDPSTTGKLRTAYQGLPMLHCTTPGAKLTVSFKGSAIGAFILAGKDAGIVQYRIDEGEPMQMDTRHRYSKGLNYPRTILFADELENGEHTLELEILAREGTSGGNAFRALQFVAN